jgi:hypothetical protein
MLALIAPFVFALVVGAQPVVPPTAPPKPAVARAASAIVISTGDLNSAVNWARQANLAEAAVRQKSPDVADQVETAINRVQTIVAASAPAKEQYSPALQDLQQAVEDANKKLAN